jgi:hypothetical protein
MKIRHISIKNYRGIKQLDWKIVADFICFIGAGDSTKSTILDAIESVLSPRWNHAFEDTDFYNLDVSQSINITVTVGQLPDSLLSEQKYGLFLRGWNPQTGLHDEPVDGDESVISISLQVGKDLEPKWIIVNDRLPDEKRISSADRSILGVSRLGSYTDKHLSWSSGSALSAMTGEDVKLNGLMAEAVRKIRSEINVHSLEEIAKVVAQAKKLGESLGVVSKNEINAQLDIKKLSVKESGVSLHDGNVPLRLAGSGTQRLMGVALQTGLQERGGISLIDEIEYGLEPHRICQVLSLLKTKTGTTGQVFLTTHSPCVLQELAVANLKIVFSEDGITRIEDIVDDSEGTYQALMRSNPFAFLAKRMIVCEGKTEIGFMRGIDKWWQESGRGMWSYGVVTVNGEGDDKSFTIAKYFQKLKYQVLWLGDSDVPSTETKKNELRQLGITVVDWADSLNFEGRLFKDLPWNIIQDLIKVAVDQYDGQSIADQVKNFQANIQPPFSAWQDSSEIREALGKAAHKKEWYKDILTAEIVGTKASKCLINIAATDLCKKIEMIRKWVSPDEHRANPA